jgi:hypothetical protein
MNWLNYLASHARKESEVRVYTMEASGEFEKYKPPSSTINIIRLGNSKGKNPILRYWKYFGFYASVSRNLNSWKPDTVMYYETLSAYPAYIYRKLLANQCRLGIHYHEYTSIREYQKGMFINRLGHLLEKKLYPLANWISHSNEDRMRLFLADNKSTRISNTYILPNYPPQSWKVDKSEKTLSMPVKFVYVGALSLDTMYLKEFANWIIQQDGRATWDIYSDNITEDAKVFLKSLNPKLVRFQDRVNYFRLPGILRNYHTGVILYNGHIPNYIFNAPNKLFEYWACGLDVWFPEIMKSAMFYATRDSYPKVIPVNFERMTFYDLDVLTDRSELQYKPSGYYCEPEFEKLLNQHIAYL